jgi:plastocyanin
MLIISSQIENRIKSIKSGRETMGKQTFKKTLGILLVVLFLATSTAAAASAQKTVDVSIQGFAFNPASVQVSA